MGRCVLLTGGPFADFCEVAYEKQPEDFLIACDRGYASALRLGLSPDLVLGDFDSYHGDIPPGVPLERACPEKDDTDTMLGVRRGLERGFREFLFLGAFGGRLDHTIANLQTLSFLCDNGARGEIRANRHRVFAIRQESLTLRSAPGYVSVFAWGGPARGVTLEGLAYPLKNAVLSPGFPLGVSNAFAGKEAVITVKQGTLLVLLCQEKTNETFDHEGDAGNG